MINNLFAAVNPAVPDAVVIFIVLLVTFPCAAISVNNCTKFAVDIVVFDTLIWGEVPVHCPAEALRNLTTPNLFLFEVPVPDRFNALTGQAILILSEEKNVLTVILTNGVVVNDPNLSKLVSVVMLVQLLNDANKLVKLVS